MKIPTLAVVSLVFFMTMYINIIVAASTSSPEAIYYTEACK